MKKNKIKNWLIHKLGGYTKEDRDNEPIKFSVQNIKLETISAIYNIDEYLMMKYSEEEIEKIIVKELVKELSTYIKPKFILEDSPIMGRRIKAKIEIPSEYIRRRDINE